MNNNSQPNVNQDLPLYEWLANQSLNINTIKSIYYLQSQDTHYIIRPTHMQKMLGYSNHTWRIVSKDLKVLGLIASVAHPDNDKRITLYYIHLTDIVPGKLPPYIEQREMTNVMLEYLRCHEQGHRELDQDDDCIGWVESYVKPYPELYS